MNRRGTKFNKLHDFWKNDPELRRRRIINKGIAELVEILMFGYMTGVKPVIIRSKNANIQLKSILTPSQPIESIELTSFTPGIRQDDELISMLKKALINGYCDLSSNTETNRLYQFFSDLEVGVE